MEITNCRSCDAPVFWVLTQNGKKVMMDADPVSDGIGFVIVQTMAGQPVAVWHKWAGDYDAEGQDVHKFHVATCPDADKHRKKKMRTAGIGFLPVIELWVLMALCFGLGMWMRGAVMKGTAAQIEREILEDVETAHEALLTCTIAAGKAQDAIDSVEAWVHRTGEYPQRLTWHALRSP